MVWCGTHLADLNLPYFSAESKLKSSEDERVMKERQQIMVDMKKEAQAKLMEVIKSKPKAYKKMLHDLVVEVRV